MTVGRVITPTSREWPCSLDELDEDLRPKRLFIAGRELPPEDNAIAIVGTRRPTAAGIEAAQEMACGLVEAGFVIVSGLAIGIDSVAHRAALHAGGTTVAVLGCGLDVLYPRRNSRLREEIQCKGSLITEYEAGTEPFKSNFPLRNRIIAGLSVGVLIIEGGPASGALSTARLAMAANKHVWALPGSRRNAMAAGPNDLIRTQQATMVTAVRHILDEVAPRLVWSDPANPMNPQAPDLEDCEKEVLALMDDVPISTERVSSRLRLRHGRAALALSRLEVRGLIIRRGGSYEITSAGARTREKLF